MGYEWASHPSLFLFLFFKTTKAGSYFAFFFSFSVRGIHRIYGLTSKQARLLPLTAHLAKINNFGPYFLKNVGTKVKNLAANDFSDITMQMNTPRLRLEDKIGLN